MCRTRDLTRNSRDGKAWVVFRFSPMDECVRRLTISQNVSLPIQCRAGSWVGCCMQLLRRGRTPEAVMITRRAWTCPPRRCSSTSSKTRQSTAVGVVVGCEMVCCLHYCPRYPWQERLGRRASASRVQSSQTRCRGLLTSFRRCITACAVEETRGQP